MTYRERREARADRLRGWADKREAKSTAAYEQSRTLGDMIPFGQPILTGHHSQRSDENRRAKIHTTMSASVEHGRKARSMNSRADNIEAAAERAIYSDDPDAIEKLQARLVELEGEREKIKRDNATFRKEHKAQLKGMTHYQRDQVMPHRGYVLTNLSGNIARNRKRLEQLQRAA
jgi:hypothetical protein